jgi:hypothetical protein
VLGCATIGTLTARWQLSNKIKLHRLPACAEGVRDVSSWHSTAVCCGAERRSRHGRGAISLSSSRYLPLIPYSILVRVATKPLPSGSGAAAKTIGITELACFAASTGAAEYVRLSSACRSCIWSACKAHANSSSSARSDFARCCRANPYGLRKRRFALDQASTRQVACFADAYSPWPRPSIDSVSNSRKGKKVSRVMRRLLES